MIVSKITTDSLERTHQLAEQFAKHFAKTGGVILLSGELGAGKTTFTQSFIKSFGIQNNIVSPTFLLMRQYQIPETERWIFHLDLYRLAEPVNLKETGIYELLESSDQNIILIEWPEKLGSNLPNQYHKIAITKGGGNTRHFTITNSE